MESPESFAFNTSPWLAVVTGRNAATTPSSVVPLEKRPVNESLSSIAPGRLQLTPISPARPSPVSPLSSINSRHPPKSKTKALTGKLNFAAKYWLCRPVSPRSNWLINAAFALTSSPRPGCSQSSDAIRRRGAK